MHFTWIGDSYELMRFRRFVFLKHKDCIIKAVRFVIGDDIANIRNDNMIRIRQDQDGL